jgi:hypothetical protein
MASKYRLKDYVQKGYDFNAIYPNKVEEVQKMTGMLFNLKDVVDYLQKQTNDFKIENPVAQELDNAIYNLILKADKKSEEPEMEKEKDYTVEWAASAELQYDLLKNKGDYDASTIAEWEASLSLLIDLLESQNYDAKELEKYKSVL